MLEVNKSEKIRKLLAKRVDRQQIVEDLKVSPQLVYAVAVNGGYLKKKAKKAKKQSKIIKAVKETKQALDVVKIKKDPKAEAWKKHNPWFGVNESKTLAALDYHEELLSDGIDPKSDEYWDKVNAKYGSKSNKRQVRLTPTQVALAKKLGISNEQYAREITALFDRSKTDPVNHPPYYKAGGIEVIDFIEAKDLNFRLGNAVKYISRAGKKASDPVQDLEKAAWYLKREIDARKGA